MSNPDIVYLVKMEYISKINIFGWKMTVKSGKEKIFWNSSMREPFSFHSFYLIERRTFAQNYKFINTNDLVCPWRDFDKRFCDECTYNKWNFKPQISPIFHFDWVNQDLVCRILCVKYLPACLPKDFYTNGRNTRFWLVELRGKLLNIIMLHKLTQSL